MQVRAVAVFLKHIEEVLGLWVLVVALISLCPSHTRLNVERLCGLFRDEIDNRSRSTASIERTARALHNLYAVDGVEVETFVVEIACHIARHALSVLEKQDMARVESLHRDFVAEPHFLDVHSWCFLLQGVLQVAIPSVHKCLSAQHLRGDGGELHGAFCSGTRNYSSVNIHHVLVHLHLEFVFGKRERARDRNIARHTYLIKIVGHITRFQMEKRLTIGICNRLDGMGKFFVGRKAHQCACQRMPCAFLYHSHLHLVLRQNVHRAGEAEE